MKSEWYIRFRPDIHDEEIKDKDFGPFPFQSWALGWAYLEMKGWPMSWWYVQNLKRKKNE